MLLTAPPLPTAPIPPTGPSPDPTGRDAPLFLVVVSDHFTAEVTPLAASMVALFGGRLLIGVATPRLEFSTDAAVLWRAALSAEDEFDRLATTVRRCLDRRAEDCEIVPLSYRPTRSATRRQRRIVAAAARLACRRRATYLQDWFLDGAAADHGANRGRPISQ